LNALTGGIVNGMLFPFESFPPLVGLTAVSVLTGILMLLAYRATSNQAGIAAVKRRIAASVFEIRLFNDDPRAIFRAQSDIMRHTLTYLGLNMVPMLWMIVPLVLLIIQLQFHYGYTGIEPGGTAVVKVRFNDATPSAAPDISFDADSGIELESPLLWIPSLREANWRITAPHAGDHELQVQIGDEVFGKQISVAETVGRRAPVRPSSRFVDELLNPAEPPLPAGALVESITVMYPEARIGFFFWETHWIVIFFVLTMLAALALQRPFKVTL